MDTIFPCLHFWVCFLPKHLQVIIAYFNDNLGSQWLIFNCVSDALFVSPKSSSLFLAMHSYYCYVIIISAHAMKFLCSFKHEVGRFASWQSAYEWVTLSIYLTVVRANRIQPQQLFSNTMKMKWARMPQITTYVFICTYCTTCMYVNKEYDVNHLLAKKAIVVRNNYSRSNLFGRYSLPRIGWTYSR